MLEASKNTSLYCALSICCLIGCSCNASILPRGMVETTGCDSTVMAAEAGSSSSNLFVCFEVSTGATLAYTP